MNTTKIMILSVAVLIMLSMLLFLTRFLLRKVISKLKDEPTTLSSTIWFITFFSSGTILINKTIFFFAEAIDVLLKTNRTDALLEDFKIGSLLSGLTILWLMLWYFLSNTLTFVITGKRNTEQEAQLNNYTYFSIRGIIHLGFTLCLLPAFELMLKTFIPQIEIPFYH